VSRLIAAEWFKIRHHKSLPILAAFAAVFAAAQVWETRMQEFPVPGWLSVTGLASLSAFNCILLAAFVGFFVATEFDNGGVRNSLALGRDRLRLYLSKQASVFTALAVILLVSSVTATIIGTVRFRFGDADAAGFLGFFCTIFALQWLYHAVYAALFSAIAFITRSPAMTVLLSIGALICEMLLTSFLGLFGELGQEIRTLLPIYNVGGLYSVRQGFFGYADPAFLTHSILVSAAAILLFCFIGAAVFKKEEIK
jgi:ABC-type transport system involved in multi-copper enzyme maturation permease subunit